MQKLDYCSKKITHLPQDLIGVDDCEEVQEISASNCKITFLTSFQHYKQLRILFLENNNLGKFFQSYSLIGAPQLSVLSLANNQITTIHESAFIHCPNLINLDLSNNKISSTFRCLAPLIDLHILDLQNNAIDNICYFKPIRFKLKSLVCLYIKNNPIDDNYSKEFEINLKSQYFPSAEFIISKFGKVKQSTLLSRIQLILKAKFFPSEQQHTPVFNLPNVLQELQSPQRIVSEENQTRKSATPTRTSTTTATDSKQIKKKNYTRSQPNLQIDDLQFERPESIISANIPQKEAELKKFVEDHNINYFPDEPSVIQEESCEQSFSTSTAMFEKNLKEFLDLQRSIKKRSKSNIKSCPDHKRRQSMSSSREIRKMTPQKQYEDLLSRGKLDEEIERLDNLITYKMQELEKVHNSILDESRQSQYLDKQIRGFTMFTKMTLGLDDSIHVQFFDRMLEKLQNFAKTIDIFSAEKKEQVIFAILKPLFEGEFYDLDQQISSIETLIQKLNTYKSH